MKIFKLFLLRISLLQLLFLILIFIFSPHVNAAEIFTEKENKESQAQINELLEESGANSLFSLIPDEGKELLSKNGIHGIDQSSLINLSFMDFIKSIWTSVQSAASKPITVLINAIGIILFCALLNSMQNSFENHSFDRVFSTVSVLCLSAVIISPIAQLIISSAEMIKKISGFLLSFVPVYIGIITASGKPVSAITYNTCLMGTIEAISYLASTILVPLLAIYLALCLIGSVSHEINMKGIAKTVKTVSVTALGLILTIFVGLLTVKGAVAASADSVTMRTAKFAVNAFLPVVGGAISEALNSVQGCVNVVKSTVGGFGILAVAAVFLPYIISILMMQFSLIIAGGVSDAIGIVRISDLIRSASSALSLLLGILVMLAILFIVSLSVMLMLSTGGV